MREADEYFAGLGGAEQCFAVDDQMRTPIMYAAKYNRADICMEMLAKVDEVLGREETQKP